MKAKAKGLIFISVFIFCSASEANLGGWLRDRTGITINSKGVSVSVSNCGGEICNALERIKNETTGKAAEERTKRAREEIDRQAAARKIAEYNTKIKMKIKTYKSERRVLVQQNLYEQRIQDFLQSIVEGMTVYQQSRGDYLKEIILNYFPIIENSISLEEDSVLFYEILALKEILANNEGKKIESAEQLEELNFKLHYFKHYVQNSSELVLKNLERIGNIENQIKKMMSKIR